MTLFHLNPSSGRAGICHDSSRDCPIGKESHFTSLAAVTHALDTDFFPGDFNEDNEEAFRKFVESLGSSLVNRKVVNNFQKQELFSSRENQILVLLGKVLLLEDSAEDERQLRPEKEKLIGEISDVYFIRNSLNFFERALMDNLVEVKNLWLKRWR